MSDYKNVSHFIFFDGGRLLPIPLDRVGAMFGISP